ncbi:MAG: BatD family protein [Polyangiaceae bacterium]
MFLGFAMFTLQVHAQSAPQMRLSASADVIGVGDALHVQLVATSGDSMPADPRLGSVSGFILRGQTESPSQTHIFVNGASSDRYTLTVDWTLVASRVGTHHIGPATVVVGASRVASATFDVKVVPAGQAPAPRPPPPAFPQMPFGGMPFDPWKNFLLGPQGIDNEPQPEPTPVATDPKLALDAPRGPEYFVHASVDKTAAVVGEQVTLSIYEYKDTAAPEVDGQAEHEASVADFVKQPLAQSKDKEQPHVGYASIAGKVWDVRLIGRWALFPLHAGDLSIGPMSVALSRPRNLAGTSRATETLRIHVTEPPLRGRPPGYVPGDVGRFTVTADVSPREVDQGGSVAVHVEVSGTGNLPTTVVAPARAGAEWLSPELHETLGPMAHDAFGGHRDFDFVVRIRDAGNVELGEIRIPFWDPEKKAYDVARAALGAVRAKANTSSAARGDEAAPERLPGMPRPRERLEVVIPTARAYLDDSPLFWFGAIASGPCAFGLAVAGRTAARRVGEALRRRRESPLAELKARVAAAQAACLGEDARAADAAIERAIYSATVAGVGVGVRGALGADVSARLEGSGLPPAFAARIATLLEECEVARFAPEVASMASVRERWARALRAIRELERMA